MKEARLKKAAGRTAEAARLALAERVKELSCLYELGRLQSADIGLSEMLQKAAELIPCGWQYPEITSARITVQGQELRCRGFKATAWQQSSDIIIRGERIGAVTVCYLQERPTRDEGPFLKEERNLIDQIARDIGFVIERKRVEEERKDLARFPSENPFPVLRVAGDATVLYANKAAEPLLAAGGSAVARPAPDEWRELVADTLATGAQRRVEVEHEGRIFSFMVIPVPEAGYVNLYGRDITERARAEESLRESEEKYRTLFSNAQVGLARAGISDGRILECNQRLAEMLGYDSREDLIAEYALPEHYVDPGKRERMLEAIRRNGEVLNFEARLTRRDGSLIWVRYYGRIFPEKGFIEEVMVDVTDEKLAQEALERQREECQTILDSVPTWIWYRDWHSTIIRANRAAAEAAGLPAEEMAGKSTREIYGDAADRHAADDLEVINSGEPKIGVIEQLPMVSGEMRWVRTDKVPYRNKAGNVVGVIVFATDITDQMRAERLLENFAQSVVENVPAIVITMDPEGRIQRFNKFAQELTGYTEEEVRGERWVDTLVLPDERQPGLDMLQGIFEGRRRHGHETSILAKDGRKILTRWYAAPLRDDTGNVVGAVGIAIDMTEIYQKEEQLRRAAKMEAIGRLAGGVAHDFNNYVTAIKGHSAILLREMPTGGPARLAAEEIVKTADRAAGLTKQLLAFGRKAIVRPRRIDLNRVLGETANTVQQILGENVRISIRPGADLAEIRADPGQIEQVVMNLAINASDAMPQGGDLIIETANVELDDAYVEQHPEASAGPHVMFAVTDSGTGMDEQTAQQIFEPFFTTKPAGKGTGLGLATVHSIVTQSGGHIVVESGRGRGTTFRVYLPRV